MRPQDSWSPGPFLLVRDRRRNRDEVQAQGHRAGRLPARFELAQQDEDRRFRHGANARRASAVELRRQLDAPGRWLELGLFPAAGRALPGCSAQPRPPRHVRGAAAGWDAASVEQPRRDPRRPRRVVRLRAGILPLHGRRTLGFPKEGFPAPQGEYYTGVGFKNVGDVARQIVDEHIDLCVGAGIVIEGVNAEVAKGQWEFQIFGKGARRAADELWIARYLMLRLCERYAVDVNFHPKPLGADVDWNGSGLHTNFSTKHMREVGGEEYFTALMNAFSEARAAHIACYGPENDLRLTGLHETAAIDEFTYGLADRGASVRIPHSFVESGHRGYLEDRRPNSMADPYRITGRILQTIETITAQALIEDAFAA